MVLVLVLDVFSGVDVCIGVVLGVVVWVVVIL